MANDSNRTKHGANDEEYRTVVFHVEQAGTTTTLHRRATKLQPALLMVQGEHPGMVIRLRPGANVIGRDPACEISLSERAASRRHADINWADASVTLTDLNSTNGTLLDAQRITAPVPLQQNALIKIGGCVFRYVDNQLDVETLEAMHSRGTTDPLTGAWNKGHLLKTLGSAMEISSSGPPLCLIGLDLDRFKSVNDTYGHLAGDLVLKETCRLVRSIVRPQDVLGRFGGEEFFVVLPGCGIEAAVAIAERIRSTIESHSFEFSGTRISVTASLGVCECGREMASPEAFIARADELLYRSKREGRNRVTTG